MPAVCEGLRAFGGADRRFQYKGCIDGVTIIDDYAPIRRKYGRP